MKLRLTGWRGALPRAVLLAVAVTLVPLPVAAAADSRSSPKAGPIKASVDKIAASDLAPARPAVARVERRAQTNSGARDASFFKTKPGILVLAVMIAGTGYAVYSTQHDRITSPAKK